MNRTTGLRARRIFVAWSIMLSLLVLPAGASAQDATPSPTPESASVASAAPIAPDAAIDPDAPLTLGPWHVATFDEAPRGFFLRGVAAGEQGFVAVGNREFDGPLEPVAWFSVDGERWERATFAESARVGIMEAAVATPDGWAAVGRMSPAGALAWTSTDGRHWERARVGSANDHQLYDVADTPLGLVAVGCRLAEFHCRTGKAWSSPDGRAWTVLSRIPIELPKAVTTVGDRTVVAGFSNGAETPLSRAVMASSANGRRWQLADPAGRRDSGFNGAASHDGAALVVGLQYGQRSDSDRVLLNATANGRAWDAVTPKAFDGWAGISVAASDDLVLVSGTGNFDDTIAPVTVSSADLEAWSQGTFTDGLRAEAYHVFDSTFSHLGDKALLVGAIDYAPGIWWADVGPVGSPEVVPSTNTAIGPPAPSDFVAASLPAGDDGAVVRDVISGGPGFIAVGSGPGADGEPEALAWTSPDGVAWDRAALADGAGPGAMVAVAALPDAAGYVAVGQDALLTDAATSPEAQGIVWSSADGTAWEQVDAGDSLAGFVPTDVVTTAAGVAAVGHGLGEQAGSSRVWTSPDGTTWELADEPALVARAMGSVDATLAVGGLDEAGDAAMLASRDGERWAMTASDPPSVILALDASEDAWVAAGTQQRPNGRHETVLHVSVDGMDWSPVTNRRLRGLTPASVQLHEAGVLVVGTRENDQGVVPLAMWTRNLEDFAPARFREVAEEEPFSVEGGGMADDGSLAFAVGSHAGQPAIWYSRID